MNTLRLLMLSFCLTLISPAGFTQEASSSPPELVSTSTININTADAEALSKMLKGIGSSKARAIIAYRESYGDFKSIDELVEIKGIGNSLLEANRALIVIK